MDLLPIKSLNSKTSLKKWLETTIKYETDMYVKDILNHMCLLTHDWIFSKSDLELPMDYGSYLDQYVQMVYSGKPSKPEPSDMVSHDYFDLKYLEEVGQVYHGTIDLANHYHIKTPDYTMMDLHEFLRQITIIYDPDPGEEEEEDIHE